MLTSGQKHYKHAVQLLHAIWNFSWFSQEISNVKKVISEDCEKKDDQSSVETDEAKKIVEAWNLKRRWNKNRFQELAQLCLLLLS